MKLTLIINPAASSVTPRTANVIKQALAHAHQLTAVETQYRGHATDIALEAVNDHADCVIVLSGDGTLNEVSNALAGSSTALAALPGGSTNVFARTIGMTNDPTEATGILLEALSDNERTRISLGSANGRYFLMNVGVGYDAAIVERVERASWLKRYAGHPYFALMALFTWARSASPREDPSFSVHFDGHVDVTSYLTLCLNSNPYTFAGPRPFDIAPDADFSKGFVVASVKDLGLPSILGVVASSLSQGRKISDNKRVDFRTEVSSFVVTNSAPFPYQLDGDYIGDLTQLTLRHHPKMLDVFMPTNH